MSFLYPRTIAIKRPGAQPKNAVGDQGEAPDALRSLETPVADSIPCKIEFQKRQGSNPTGLPADSDGNEWQILIPKRALCLGTVKEGDIVIDDLGERYQVYANYWDSLGYALRAQKQKA